LLEKALAFDPFRGSGGGVEKILKGIFDRGGNYRDLKSGKTSDT